MKRYEREKLSESGKKQSPLKFSLQICDICWRNPPRDLFQRPLSELPVTILPLAPACGPDIDPATNPYKRDSSAIGLLIGFRTVIFRFAGPGRRRHTRDLDYVNTSR